METSQSSHSESGYGIIGSFVVSLERDGKQQVHSCVTYGWRDGSDGIYTCESPSLSLVALGKTRLLAENRMREQVRALGGATGPTIRKAVPRACPPPANDYQIDESDLEDDVDDDAPTLRMIQTAEPVEIPFDLVAPTLVLVDVECTHCGAKAQLATESGGFVSDLECPACHVVGGLVKS